LLPFPRVHNQTLLDFALLTNRQNFGRGLSDLSKAAGRADRNTTSYYYKLSTH
jgi:hypothetical protein